MKRFLSLLLSLALLLPAIPTPTKAATSTDEIRATVTDAYEELLAVTSPGEGGASDGAMQLLNHAISGGGKDLIMDETDHYTGMLLRSNMYRDGFINGMTAAFEKLLGDYGEKLLVNGSYQFYEHKKTYAYAIYKEFNDIFDVEGGMDEDWISKNEENWVAYLAGDWEWAGPVNKYDEALILLNGNCTNLITIEKSDASNDKMSYHVSIRFWDNFDFGDGNYEGSDAEMAKLLTWVGKLMQFGAIVSPFHMEVLLDFDITFDNQCPHKIENFRWEQKGTDIVSVSGTDWGNNPTIKEETISQETGEAYAPFFELEKTVKLEHDRPWVVEFRVQGVFLLTPVPGVEQGKTFIMKASSYLVGGEFFKYTGTNEETGTEEERSGRDQYGIWYRSLGYQHGEMNTYRIENRIQANGENMAYLIINGEEVGPMNNRIVWTKEETVQHKEPVDWFSGKDFEINYIYSHVLRLEPTAKLEYAEIWPNGENTEGNSYYYTKQVAPTCTGKGYVSHICSQCGDTWNDNFVDPLGHKLGAYTKKNDKLHSRTCTVCGEEQVDIHTLENGACTLCDYSATKSVQGIWTTDLTLSASDLGVSAPDSVLRATLTFTEDGKATATWEAVDLTAFKVFFHDMFVSSYYAMAYGAGITDIQQIEQLCMDSTGLSVSAYMDTIVTDEAMKAAFTPPSTQGTYRYAPENKAIFTDLALMDVPSDPNVPNSFTVENGTMHLNAASYGKPDYTFVCMK